VVLILKSVNLYERCIFASISGRRRRLELQDCEGDYGQPTSAQTSIANIVKESLAEALRSIATLSSQ